MNNTITKELVVVENEVFDKYFSNILIDIGKLSSMAENTRLSTAKSWIEKVCSYNATQGKKIRGSLVPLAVRSLLKCPSEVQMNHAYILGWCVELLGASFLVADDIMDQSSIRRGVPCWYRVDELGLDAVNDAFLLEHVAYELINMHFRNTRYYSDLLDLFLDMARKTAFGQCLDTLTGRKLKFEEYTMERYETTVKNKTSITTFYFPVAIAAIISNVDYQMFLDKLEEIAVNLGLLFQVLDDYLDCFGSSAETGKDGTDIQNGKCSWPFVRSKELCSADQLSELYENYGQQDELKIARVLKIYRALNMSKLVHEFTENTIKSTVKLIEQFENVDLKFLFYQPLERFAKQLNTELSTFLI